MFFQAFFQSEQDLISVGYHVIVSTHPEISDRGYFLN